jgi:hypothetical protein
MRCLDSDPVMCAAKRLGVSADEILQDGSECTSRYHDMVYLGGDGRDSDYEQLPYNCLRMAARA